MSADHILTEVIKSWRFSQSIKCTNTHMSVRRVLPVDRTTLLQHLRECLALIKNPRFFESERGFQGELLALLKQRIPNEALPEGALLEQEYQKRLGSHGLKIRPDIIIHEPFDPERHQDRTKGNYAVIELKLTANPNEAAGDFKSLSDMVTILQYPLAIFINIASTETYIHLAPEQAKGHLVCFATTLSNGRAVVVENQT